MAKRLVKDAVHSQVIVFTYDLFFLFDLQREAGVSDKEFNISDGTNA